MPPPATTTAQGRVPRHQVVADELVARITDGTYRLGDQLPTEEELCTHYGLARGTVRQALAQLVQLGMIERRPRAGTRVIATRPVEPYRPFVTTPSEIADLVASTRLLRPEVS